MTTEPAELPHALKLSLTGDSHTPIRGDGVDTCADQFATEEVAR